jgi:hypothetical protein
VDSQRDRQPACGFCDGTGLWPDPDGDQDPCPLCDGAGIALGNARDDAVASESPHAPRRPLPRLSQTERQRLESCTRYDCRIYRQ